MLRIDTLSNPDFADLTRCFNEAFADYVMKFEADETYLRNRWQGSRVDFSRSVGAWEGDKMVGFMVIGYDEWEGQPTAFNAGTGIIPAHRGKGLLGEMYQFLFAKLENTGVKQHMLEVIASNAPAIRAYEKVGFTRGRKLHCFKREKNRGNASAQGMLSVDFAKANWEEYAALSEFPWSWDCGEAGMRRMEEGARIGEMRDGNQLLAFAIANMGQRRLYQFGVVPGWERQLVDLVNFVLEGRIDMTCVNIDAQAPRSLELVKSFGFVPTVDQWEMKMEI